MSNHHETCTRSGWRSVPGRGVLRAVVLASTALCLAGSGALSSRADAAPVLSYRSEVPAASGWYRAVHIADVDGNGRPDILIGNWSTNTIEIWTYDPALEHAVLSQTIAMPYSIHGIGSGDIDEDGDVDIVAAIRFAGVYLCRNNGGGNWTVSQLDSRYAWNVQVADIDHDGHLDVFGALDGIGAVLLYGNGTGAFTAGATPPLVWPGGINVVDFDHDGLLDLLGGDATLGYMLAYRNLGGRAWSANLGPADYHPNQLAAEITPSALDLYGNGNLSPVAVYYQGFGYIPPLTLVLYEGMGTPYSPAWSPRVLDVLDTRATPSGEADLNDDGKPDIFLGGSAGFLGFRAYLGDGAGNFALEEIPFTHGLGIRNSFSVVDVDGDGASDIVAPRHQLGVFEPSAGFAILYRVPDRTAPTASPTRLPAPNGAGWNNSDVTVTWNWTDTGGSGIDTANCTTTTTSSGEGDPLTLTATCNDLAGNSGSATYDVRVDKTAPLLTLVGGPANGGTYYFGSVPVAPTCTASDALSHLDGACSVTGYSTAVGAHTITATARDLAGNVANTSVGYTVLGWTVSGFYRPVDMGGVWNVVKGGSTVPLKFEVFAGTTELTTTSVVLLPLVAAEAACTGGPSDDVDVVATGGTSLRYDASGGQFLFNWQTPKKSGYCYVLTVNIADGSSLSANFRVK